MGGGGAGPSRLIRARHRLTTSERRRRILDTSARHFARHGFSGARIRKIALACGVADTLLFHHFPSKDALYREILDSRLSVPEREIFPPFSRFDGDDEAFLSAVASGLLARMESDPSFTRLLFYGALEDHDLAHDFVDCRIRKSVRYVARYLALRQRQGGFRKVDSLVAARAFLGMVVHHSLLTHLFGYPLRPAVPQETLVRAWVALFLNGVRKASEKRA